MPHEDAKSVDMRRLLQTRGPDALIAELAGRQHGVVARAQLVGFGLRLSAIDRRLRAGRLHLLHRGVYAIGHRVVSREGQWMAAVLAGGEGAILSHRSAAALWGLRRTTEMAGKVEITAPRATKSSGRLERHRGERRPDEVTTRRRIPVTTAARTLLDLAAVLRPEAVEAALREAEVLRLPLRPPFEELLARYSRGRGAGVLRACLLRLDHLPAQRTRSALEARFLSFLAKRGLPAPETNVLLGLNGRMIEADCLWRHRRLIVELDGHAAHGTRSAFESDRGRDRLLHVADYKVVRVTWRQLDEEPGEIARDLKSLLGVD